MVLRSLSARILGIMLAVGAFAIAAPTAWAGLVSLTAPQGATITISGMVSSSADCPAGAPVQLTSTPAIAGGPNLFPNGVGPKAGRDANGNFSATYTIPPSTPTGSYTIGVQCGSTTPATSQVLNVTAAATAKPSIAVSPPSAPVGSSITVTGFLATSGAVFCPAGDAVQLTSTSALFPQGGFGPQVTRDASGNFHATYTIPATTAPGAYTVGMRCGGGNVGVTASLQVTAVAASTTTTVPASTTTTAPAAVSTTTSVAPTTTVPATTTTTAPTTKSNNKSPVRWVALGLLALVVVAAVVVILVMRDTTR